MSDRTDRKRVVVVCGYGCDIDSPLKPYLDKVVAFYAEKKPDVVILCGGETQQKSFPGENEIIVMRRYLFGQLGIWPECWCDGWFSGEDSYTAFESIRVVADTVRCLLPYRPEFINAEITIFCEATRALQVALLARHFFGFPPVKIETDSWELSHPAKELKTTFFTLLCCHIPLLWRYFRWRRIRRSMSS